MKIKAIEPTPSPNTMKVLLDEQLPPGKRNNYRKETAGDAPPEIKKILELDGVKSVFHVADFLAVERFPKADWKAILSNVRQILGDDEATGYTPATDQNEKFGEVQVFVQFLKEFDASEIDHGTEENGSACRAYIRQQKSQLPGDNIILLRKWIEKGPVWGLMKSVRYCGRVNGFLSARTVDELSKWPSIRPRKTETDAGK